jgi:cytochrome b561
MNQLKYTRPAIYLHWLLFFGLTGAFMVGTYMEGLSTSPWKIKVFTWHKWAGVTLFLLILLRLFWRMTHQPPAYPASMTVLLKKIAKATHYAMYLFMVLIPITGWLHSSAAGISVVYFNLIPLPDLIPKNKEWSKLLGNAHSFLNWTLFWMVGLHVAAVVKHEFIDEDHLLSRMKL